MTEPTALQILKAARTKLADPRNWGKGWRQGRAFHTCCAAEAIEESARGAIPERKRAYRALANAAGIEKQSIVAWNDAPERQYIDVWRAFNLAIATLSLGAPIRTAGSATRSTIPADPASPSGGRGP